MVEKLMKLMACGALSMAIAVGSAALPLQQSSANQMEQKPVEAGIITVPKVFHIAGIPGLKCNKRGDLTLNDRELIFRQKNKQQFAIPYERIRRVQLLSGKRDYGKTAAAASVASIAATGFAFPGALLLLKKRKVDTLVIDYTNERGGLAGIALQLPEGQGAPCKEKILRSGTAMEEPQFNLH